MPLTLIEKGMTQTSNLMTGANQNGLLFGQIQVDLNHFFEVDPEVTSRLNNKKKSMKSLILYYTKRVDDIFERLGLVIN